VGSSLPSSMCSSTTLRTTMPNLDLIARGTSTAANDDEIVAHVVICFEKTDDRDAPSAGELSVLDSVWPSPKGLDADVRKSTPAKAWPYRPAGRSP
jgi:hypothetical protein